MCVHACEAEEMEREVFALQKRVHGAEHPYTHTGQ
jgi:hypothetical protein